jgi:predicted double-glycine peptidase
MIDIPDVRQSTGYTCGPAAVRAALSAVGYEFSEADLAAAMGTTTAGTSPRGMLAALRTMGFDFTAGTMDLSDLAHFTRRGCPVVCLTTLVGGHYVTVAGLDRRCVHYHDPLAGTLWFPRRHFLDRWHDGDWQQWACAIRG